MKNTKQIRLKRKPLLSPNIPSHNGEDYASRSITEQLEAQNHGQQSAAVEGHDKNDASSSSKRTTWDTQDLQPAGLLSKEAQTGRFSLQNILCIPDVLRPDSDPVPDTSSKTNLDNRDDPIACNILTFPVALGLLDR